MDKILFVLIFIILAAADAEYFDLDYDDDLAEKTRQYISEQNMLTRDKMKSDMDNFFANMSQSFNQKLNTSELKIFSDIGSLSVKIEKLQKQLSYLFPTGVEVEELSMASGTIEFKGGENSNLRRKIWILRNKNPTSINYMRFILKENNLGYNSHLTLWGMSGNYRHVWKGSQEDWKTERGTWNENLILLTLTMKAFNSLTYHPTFKLTFDVTSTKTPATQFSSFSNEIIQKDGLQFLTFPPQNAHNYPPRSLFQAVIAPRGGTSFQLTLKYLDVPHTSSRCSESTFTVWFLRESATEVNFEQVPPSSFSSCGRLGNISEVIGRYTVAVVNFAALTHNVGSGLKLEVRSDYPE